MQRIVLTEIVVDTFGQFPSRHVALIKSDVLVRQAYLLTLKRNKIVHPNIVVGTLYLKHNEILIRQKEKFYNVIVNFFFISVYLLYVLSVLCFVALHSVVHLK